VKYEDMVGSFGLPTKFGSTSIVSQKIGLFVFSIPVTIRIYLLYSGMAGIIFIK
jgi:hypothetical protein